MTRQKLAYLLLFALLAGPLAAQDAAPFDRIFLDPALKTADYDAHLATLLNVIQTQPDSVGALVALRRAAKLNGRCASMQPLYDWLAGRAREDFKNCGAWADDYAEVYVELARKHAADPAWKAVAAKWRGITEWAYIGPFTEGPHAAHDDTFAPEVMLDFAAQYDGAYGPIRWQALRHDNPLSARTELWSQQRWNGAGYFLCTALISDADREVTLRANFDGPGKLWLNGEYLLDVDTRGKDWPEIVLPVNLKRGRNLLLIKMSGLSAMRAAVLGKDGGPLQGVLAEAPKSGDPRMAVRGGAPAKSGVVAPGVGELDARNAFFREDHTGEGLLSLAAATIHASHNNSWQAGELLERTNTLLANEPLARIEFLRGLDSSPMHSSSERRRLRREITDALLADDPGLIPAVIEKADLFSEDQRYREAVKLLEAAREKAPENWRLSMALAEVYKDASWRSDELRELKRACVQAPSAIPVLRALSRYYANHDELANRIAIDREILKLLPGDRDAHWALCGTLLRTSDSAEALKHARYLASADPGNTGVLQNLAETLVAAGRIDEALQTWERLYAMTPRPEDYMQQAARACLQLGRQELAEKLLERALAAGPGEHAARRQLQRMRGESEDFWSDHALSWEDAMAHDVTPEQFPRASSALVLDELVQVMYEDGSSLSYVHQVRKVLTQDGVDEHGKQQSRGELVTARTVTPDGNVLEPISQESGTIEFPGVTIGCYIDVAYIERNDGGPHRTLDGSRFFFADHELNEPFCVSRWVLVAPKSARLQFLYHNLVHGENGATISNSDNSGNLVRAWDVRNPQHPEPEPLMPSGLEFIPWIECVVPHDWRTIARKLAEETLPDTRTTQLIFEKALDLTFDEDEDIDPNEVTNPVGKARAIYDWVNVSFATEGDTFNAHQALKAGAGDRRKLFIALCTAAGVKLGFAYADTSPPYKRPTAENIARPHWAFARTEDFNQFLVAVWNEKGDATWIDLDARMRPFGALGANLNRAPAILWRDGKYELIHLPGTEAEGDRFENSTTIELNADGSATLSGSSTIRGERSYGLKEMLRNVPVEQLRRQVQAQLAQAYPGLQVSETRFPGLADIGVPFKQEFEGKVKRIARASDDTLTLDLPGEKTFDLIGVVASTQTRKFDIHMPFDFVQTEEMRIKPPKGYAFAAVPDGLLYPTAPLEYSLQFRMDGGDLVMTRKFVIGPGRIGAAEYAGLVEQVKQIRAAEAVKLKLVKAE